MEVVWFSGLAVGLGEKSNGRIFVFVMLCNQKEGCSLRSFWAGGWGYLGQFLLGMCRWPLKTRTLFQSTLWPIVDPIFVTFGET